MIFIDIGCSGGVPSRWKQFEDLEVIGFDISANAIELLRKEKPKNVYHLAYVGENEPNIGAKSDYAISNTQCYAACNILQSKNIHTTEEYLSFLVTREDPINAASEDDQWARDPFVTYYRNFFSKTTEVDKVSSVEPAKVPRIKLDECISLSTPAFLKVDTDGSELRVLESFQDGLESPYLLGIEIECQMRGVVSAGSSTFSNIDLLLRNYGFTLWELEPVRYQSAFYPDKFLTSEPAETPRGQVQFCNATYIRKPKDTLSRILPTESEIFQKAYRKLSMALAAPDVLIEFIVFSAISSGQKVDLKKLDEISLEFSNENYQSLIKRFIDNPKAFYVHFYQNRYKNFCRRILHRLLRYLN